jgi:hypothetical protein
MPSLLSITVVDASERDEITRWRHSSAAIFSRRAFFSRRFCFCAWYVVQYNTWY